MSWSIAVGSRCGASRLRGQCSDEETRVTRWARRRQSLWQRGRSVGAAMCLERRDWIDGELLGAMMERLARPMSIAMMWWAREGPNKHRKIIEIGEVGEIGVHRGQRLTRVFGRCGRRGLVAAVGNKDYRWCQSGVIGTLGPYHL